MDLKSPGLKTVAGMCERSSHIQAGVAGRQLNGLEIDQLIGEIDQDLEAIERFVVSSAVHNADLRIALRIGNGPGDPYVGI